MRLEDDVIAQQRKSRSCPDVFVPSDLSAQARQRHHRQVPARASHHGDSGRAHDHEARTEVADLGDVRAGDEGVEVPHHSREVTVAAAEKVMREALQKHTDVGRRENGQPGPAVALAEQCGEPQPIGSKARARLAPAQARSRAACGERCTGAAIGDVLRPLSARM